MNVHEEIEIRRGLSVLPGRRTLLKLEELLPFVLLFLQCIADLRVPPGTQPLYNFILGIL